MYTDLKKRKVVLGWNWMNQRLSHGLSQREIFHDTTPKNKKTLKEMFYSVPVTE